MKNQNLKSNLKNLTAKKKLYLAGAAICLLLFAVSVFQIISHYANAHKAEEEFAQLAEIVEQAEDTPEEDMDKTGETEEQSPLERYRELFDMNNDMAGWITVDGTQINYPVMYTPDNPDFYLKHNFEKLCLCSVCAGHFYNVPDYYIRRVNREQTEKETCIGKPDTMV